MKRPDFFNYIEERISFLAYRIEKRGHLNLLDLNIHSENFYCHFLNLLYNYQLYNMNTIDQNSAAVDLVDDTNKLIVQVSSNNKTAKVNDALSKLDTTLYQGYSFRFVSIAKSAKNLRKKTYTVPAGISFDAQKDIYDVDSILKDIGILEFDLLEHVYLFIEKELGNNIPAMRLESNLTEVIKLLSQENLADVDVLSVPPVFQIEQKLSYNGLIRHKRTIKEYNIYHNLVDKIYSEFDKMGKNKSLAVLSKVQRIYVKWSSVATGDDLMDKVTEEVKQEILNSSNWDSNITASDEMELCVDVIVVDAFVRCKIFNNPENYRYAVT